MEESKEKLFAAAEELILTGDGAVEKITTRAIAEKAGVGVGLVNYHFQTKDRLIELCVQRMIQRVVSGFHPSGNDKIGTGRLKAAAKEVFDFLFGNPAVSRISILGDIKAPEFQDNTMGTVSGFLGALGTEGREDRAKVFAFTSALQTAFLRWDISRECLGYDLSGKPERDAYIELLADSFFGKEK